MNTTTINDHKIVYYSDIDDTPIGRYNAFSANILYDCSVGNTMEAINERFESMDAHLEAGNNREARIERNNLQITFFSIMSQVNFAARALICLIYSIDGEKVTDLSEGGIATTLEKLNEIEISIGEIRAIVFGQKKKLKAY